MSLLPASRKGHAIVVLAPSPDQQTAQLYLVTAFFSPSPISTSPITDSDLPVHAALYFVFTQFSIFGRTGQLTHSPMLDNANWAKFLKSCPDLIDGGGGNVGRSDIDLFFMKAKGKEGRKIDFTQFLQALSMVALKRYPDSDPIQSFSQLCSNHVFGVLQSQGGNTRVSASYRVTQALLGLEGSEQGGQQDGTPNGSKANVANISSTSNNTNPSSPSQQPQLNIYKNAVLAGSSNKQGGIYDRLASPSTFTGTYKNLNPNNAVGQGGINSYSGDISGNIRDLSSIIRPDMKQSRFMGVDRLY